MADAKAAVVESDADIEDGAEAAAAAQAPASQPFWKRLLVMPSRKTLIIGGIALAVIGGGGFAAHHFLLGGPHEAKVDTPAVKPVVFVDMPEVMVNLSTTGAERTQYLRIKIVLELPDQKMIDQIQPIMPRVMDAFQTYLRELRPSDLDGSAGLYRLKEELTRRINASTSPSRINAVLFKEIVVQ
jgi:flagellar FliL protein